jgi:hypothetical protein
MKKDKCTGIAGYLTDAEIAKIMKDSSRVVKSYVDTTSNSDVLIYDNDEWVSYMSAATKKVRTSLYAAWGLGGTTDWATDLQMYHDVPKPAYSWTNFIVLASSGGDPKMDHMRNGNWTDFNCTALAVIDFLNYTPSEQWRLMGADAAWDDIVWIWKDTDSQHSGVNFSALVESTTHLGGQAGCGVMTTVGCTTVDYEKGTDSDTLGPAAMFISNLLAEIHRMYKSYYNTLFKALTIISMALDDIENKFAPILLKEDDT